MEYQNNSVLGCICSVMTPVKYSVVSVVMFNHFLSDPADADNVLNLVNIDGQRICLQFKRAGGINIHDQHIWTN